MSSCICAYNLTLVCLVWLVEALQASWYGRGGSTVSPIAAMERNLRGEYQRAGPHFLLSPGTHAYKKKIGRAMRRVRQKKK